LNNITTYNEGTYKCMGTDREGSFISDMVLFVEGNNE